VSTNQFPSTTESVPSPFEDPATPPATPASTTASRRDAFWQVFLALLTWFASAALLLVVPLLVATPYVIYKSIIHPGLRPESLVGDKTLILLSLLGVIPAHVLSFLIVWGVVTSWGRRPFWETIRWSWPENFGPWKSVLLAIALLLLGWLITYALGGQETQLDLFIKSSYAARVTTAFLAAVTAPFVEELIYRGVMYSALQRAFGLVWAVIVVSMMFAAVHVYQYYNNLGVIAVISMLSISLTLVRAFSGRLLPCFVMHAVFNGIQSVFLVLEPYLENLRHADKQKAAVIYLLELVVRHLR
jgi:membrane protease YdiL (CAAX protease family)